MQGSFLSENIFMIAGFITVVGIVFPWMIFSAKKTKSNMEKFVEKLALKLGGRIISARITSIWVDEKVIFFEKNGCKYLINPFSAFLTGTVIAGTFSSVYIEASFSRSINTEFEAFYDNYRFLLIGKNKFNERYIDIVNKDVFEKFVGYDNFVNFIKSLDFKFDPDLVLKIKENKLQLYFAKIEYDVNEWMRYMEFFDNIVNKINQAE